MDAADLKIFEAVARLGAMNRAALELNTVQSNVTARIRQLEQELGATLFERHSRGVTLTPAGQRLLPHATGVAQALADARRAVNDEGYPSGDLTIGSLETAAALRLSPLLADYAAAFPAVDLVLRTGTTAELVADVLAHRLEGAFVSGPVDHPDLAAEVIFQERLVVATAPQWTSLELALSQPRLKTVVLRAGCSYRQRLEEVLVRRGIVGLRMLEFGTIEAIVGCVAAGLGPTLLPLGTLAPAHQAGRVAIHHLPDAEALADTVFIHRHDAYVSSALTAFVNRARNAFVELAAE